MKQIQLTPKQWEIIKSILSQYPYTFYAYGSRTKNKARKYSDLDLCYKENIPDHIISAIEEKFEQSDLPFKVELVSWQRCSPDFQQLIAKDLVELKL